MTSSASNFAPTPFSAFDLTGLHALVTGASSGLGQYMAMTLASAGTHVHAAARSADRLAPVLASR